jgi:hypothetical protein
MAKTRAEKIESYKTEIEQLENKRKKLIQEEKAQERKDRTRRLCKRMGLFESLLPDSIPLSEEQFKIFLEKTIITDHSRRILDGLAKQNTATVPPEGAGTAAQSISTPAAKPSQKPHDSGTSEDGGEGNGTRVTG